MARWIKVGVDTPYKAAIAAIARDCGCGRGDAFLAWFELYAWLDEQTADGTIFADRDLIDRKAGVPGVAASLEKSGWLTFLDNGTCLVANWDEHNGQSAKRRAQSARLMTELREERRRGAPVPPCQ